MNSTVADQFKKMWAEVCITSSTYQHLLMWFGLEQVASLRNQTCLGWQRWNGFTGVVPLGAGVLFAKADDQ